MRPDEQSTPDDSHLSRQKFELFYFERVGSRSYLHFTRSAVILVIALTVVSVISLLFLFLRGSRQSLTEPVNVNVSVPSSTPYRSDKPIIQKPPPQPTPPKVGKQPTPNMHVPSMSPTPAKNVNEQLTPKAPSRTSPLESSP
jgi:hypothetical protein